MSKSTPPAPDYTGAANAQANASREITNTQNFANRPNINTPWGTQTWDTSAQVDPATGQSVTQWTQNNTLNPESQAALDAQMRLQSGRSRLAEGMLGSAQQQFSGQPDWNSFRQLQGSPDVPNYQGAPGQSNLQNIGSSQGIQRGLDTNGLPQVDSSSKYYGQAGDAVYNQWANRNEPRFQQSADQLRTKLYNQGFKEGDQGYNAEMQRLSQDQADARQQASLGATQAAGQEASRMFGMDLGNNQNQFGQRQAAGQFGNAAQGQEFGQNLQGMGFNNQNAQTLYGQQMQGANMNNANSALAFNQGQGAAQQNNQLRQQQIAEMMQQRGFSLNEINGILNGQQVATPNMPSFNTANASQTPNLLGAAQAQYGAQMDAFNARQAGTQGLLSGITGAAMGFSDRRLKNNVVFLGKVRGHNLYSFDYVWGEPSVGVMADEVAHIPGAVTRHSSGYDMVNYGRI